MKKLIIVLSVLFLFGCSAVPSQVGEKRAKKLMKTIAYVQDPKTGLCYAVASSRIWYLGMFPSEQKGLGLSLVPCESCRDQLINN